MKPDRDADNRGLKPILFCADDFGMSPQINAGIIELANSNVLSAVSCLSRGKDFQQDAPILADLPVAKGLHLNLTESLAGNEYFQPLHRLIWSCYARRIDPQVIRVEIENQLDAFERSFGTGPDYVDGHQHVHQFPIVRDCLIEILLRRYGKRLPWLRSTLRSRQPGVPAGIQMKAAVIASLGAHALQALAIRHGFKTNAHLLGVYGFDGGEEAYGQLLAAWIHCAGPNDLIMCHPARGLDSADPIGVQRCAEFAVLAGSSRLSLLERHRAFVASSVHQ